MSYNLWYFGTNLTTSGHFMWNLSNDYFIDPKFFKDYKNILPADAPDPYDIFFVRAAKELGDTFFIQKASYTVCAINGSCIDARDTAISVFYVDRPIAPGPFMAELHQHPLASKIMRALRFPLNYPELPTPPYAQQFCTLSNPELAEKCEALVDDGLSLGGDYNEDPNLLLRELIDRFKQNPKFIK